MEVKSHSPNDRFVIALHSPSGLVETGLHIRPPEKMAAKPLRRNSRDTFSSPVSSRESRNCGISKRFSEECSLVSLHPRLYGGARSLALTILPPEVREKYRGIYDILLLKNCTHVSLSCTFCWRNWEVQLKSEQGPIRELTGRYQGIYFLIRIYCRRDLAGRGFCGNPNS
jgi:hypothetical protein